MKFKPGDVVAGESTAITWVIVDEYSSIETHNDGFVKAVPYGSNYFNKSHQDWRLLNSKAYEREIL